ncbi:dipeptidyl peptidase IV N-terminal region-domain-containing protein [Dipodascopsis tothii]|uniref:dipeptidyl peptidase IV N-terminal region-domain-containing protein n=1 Tax=Dipodascopsis tothii TaxID=44089 RepID=UPI0034CE3B18
MVAAGYTPLDNKPDNAFGQLSTSVTFADSVPEASALAGNEDENYSPRSSTESTSSSTSIVFDKLQSVSSSFKDPSQLVRQPSSHSIAPSAKNGSSASSAGSSVKSQPPTEPVSASQKLLRSASALSTATMGSLTGLPPGSPPVASGRTNLSLKIKSKSSQIFKSVGSTPVSAQESDRLLLASLDRNGQYRDTEAEAPETAADVDLESAAPVAPVDDAEDDDVDEQPLKQALRQKRTKRLMFGVVGVLVFLWTAGLIYYVVTNRGDTPPALGFDDQNPIALENVMAGQFFAHKSTVEWLDDGIKTHDGQFAERDSEGRVVVGDYSDYVAGTQQKRAPKKTVLVDMAGFDYLGEHHTITRAWPGKGLAKVLLGTDLKKNWRHSYFAQYWIYDVANKTVEPLIADAPEAMVRLALWSPSGTHIAFVLDNNLYLRDVAAGAVPTAITKDGGKDTFYGIPDWVYEEEVFSGNSAMWWSDDGKYLAFLRSNDSMVPEYTIPYFESFPIENTSYPNMVDIKYPKAGYPNPVVEMMFLDVETLEVFMPDIEGVEDDTKLFTEVTWMGSSVLIRQTTRESDLLKILVIDAEARKGSIAREEDASGKDGGWFEVTQDTKYVPADEAKGRPYDGYIDTVVVDGYNHLAYFSPLYATQPAKILTRGDWEVVDAPSAVNLDTGDVYFFATKKDPTERHLYSVNLNDTAGTITAITDESQDGYYAASFSARAGYMLLSYNGPQVPWQKIMALDGKGMTEVETVETNEALRQRLKTFRVPTTTYTQMTFNEGGEDIVMNTMEIRPADFDPTKKYPVLFHIYGGPGSQTVDKRYVLHFEAHVVSAMDAIVVSVDGRGTGFMGRKFRAVVRDQLGYWEAHDQILVAREYATRPYVDASKIAIWGWSYGGYMTLKTLEQDGGDTFSYGMAVAPVTDWRFYDSIYTERYMHTPQHNAAGYDGSAIKNVTALKSAERFLVMHGTGDDNVHFQNTLALVDKFDLAGVENYDMYVFPDSDHSIYFHNANRIVYDRLGRWISMAFGGFFVEESKIEA